MQKAKELTLEQARRDWGAETQVVKASDYQTLLEENALLRGAVSDKLIESTELSELLVREGSLGIEANGGVFRIMADAFGQVLIDGQAENYIEAWFKSETHPDIGSIVVTARKEAGMTPHQLRLDAEQQRDLVMSKMDNMIQANRTFMAAVHAALNASEGTTMVSTLLADLSQALEQYRQNTDALEDRHVSG